MPIKKVADTMIYATVALGCLLLFASAPLVPAWLFVSLTVGVSAYAACAMGVGLGWRGAYYAVIALAVLVLLVSLPQQQHYEFASGGELGDFLIFAVGSVLQVCLLILVPIHLRRTRRD